MCSGIALTITIPKSIQFSFCGNTMSDEEEESTSRGYVFRNGGHADNEMFIIDHDERTSNGNKSNDGNEMYPTWLYFVTVCVALIIIGNVFLLWCNGRCTWNKNKSRVYSKVKTVASSDEDLSALEEIDLD